MFSAVGERMKQNAGMQHCLLIIGLMLPVGPLLAEDLLWVGDEDSANAYMRDLAPEFTKRTGHKIEMKLRGTSRGIRQVYTGQADMGGAGRFRLEGIPEEDVVKMTPIVWDPLVVIVNEQNPAVEISRAQLKQLLSGSLKSWAALGGSEAPIHAFTRSDDLSGAGIALRKLLFASFDVEFDGSTKVKTGESMVAKVVDDVNAIAVVGLASGHSKGVKMLKLDGVEPSYDNIISSRYFFYRPLYLVSHPTSKKRAVIAEFEAFAQGSWAEEQIIKNGAVPYRKAPHLVLKVMKQEREAFAQGFR